MITISDKEIEVKPDYLRPSSVERERARSADAVRLAEADAVPEQAEMGDGVG